MNHSVAMEKRGMSINIDVNIDANPYAGIDPFSYMSIHRFFRIWTVISGEPIIGEFLVNRLSINYISNA